jgi:ABC-2 type transport system permease protein
VLGSLRGALSLYGRYIAISMRGQLQYRASFAMLALGQLVGTGVEFIGIWALFHRFGALGPWSLAQVAFLYGLADVGFALASAFCRGFDTFGNMVKSGDFDRLLLRPRSTVLQLLGQELHLMRVGRLAQGLVILIWAGQAAGVDWSAATVGLLLTALAGGVCLYTGIIVLQATSTFWTVETLEVWSSFTYGGNYASQYPLTIYRPWFRRALLTALPLGCVVYLPGVAILGATEPLGTPVELQWAAPLAGVAFLLVSLQIWRLGVRRYTSTGS